MKLTTQEQITRLRNSRYSAKELSDIIKISIPYINQIKNGRIPSEEIQNKIKELYNYTFVSYRKPYDRKLNKEDRKMIIYTVIGLLLSIGVGYLLYINFK
jgi:transcriptional regulator with XRE-family HTH domain